MHAMDIGYAHLPTLKLS